MAPCPFACQYFYLRLSWLRSEPRISIRRRHVSGWRSRTRADAKETRRRQRQKDDFIRAFIGGGYRHRDGNPFRESRIDLGKPLRLYRRDGACFVPVLADRI